jgi:hypothetical protein
MKIIHDKRGTGKTTKLIKLCAKNNGLMVCFNTCHVNQAIRIANCNNIKIEKPITFYQFIHNPAKYNRPLYFDDMDLCLKTVQDCIIGGISVAKEHEEKNE